MPIDRQGGPLQARATLAFSILVLTGPFIWWPKDWSWTNLKKIVVLRRGLGGRALYWNWHNVLGAWCAIPLLIIVMSGVVMSYPWANNLLYRLTGNEPPAPPQAAATQQRPRGEGKPHTETAEQSSPSPLEKVIIAAEQVPQWQSITIRMPSGRGGLSATADQGNGRPDLRTQFIFDPKTGDVRQEAFSSYNSGRRLRTWARFSHTGEAGGIVGETIA
ncbi:MAG TPA: PepSY-associated TM helix domain-containing protein, partial [Terriglobales bacterium]